MVNSSIACSIVKVDRNYVSTGGYNSWYDEENCAVTARKAEFRAMEYLSYSRLTLHDTCGLRFFYEYVEKREPVDEVPTYHASFGKLLHALYEEHAVSHGQCNFDQLKSRFDERFPTIVSEFASRDDAVQFYKRGVQAIWRFSRYKIDDVIASEKEFLLDIAPGIPPVKGFIDRVLEVPSNGYVVADLKTGKVFSATDKKKMRQLVLYSSACEDLYGMSANDGYFDFVVHGGRAWVTITDEDRQQAKVWVTKKWQQILDEQFYPRYSRNFCSQYCPFRSLCKEYQERTLAV